MVAICLYFQIHQPTRINHYRVRQIGQHAPYFDEAKNREIFRRVASKCYWPAGRLLFSLLKQFPDEFRVTFSLSGTFLEQCEQFDPELLEFYQEMLSLPNVEILCETYAHSLASLKDREEFFAQVKKHRAAIELLFNKKPTVFRNTELIYSDAIGEMVARLGFKGCLVEGWDLILPRNWNQHHLFHHTSDENLILLPRSYRLSDDIAFRFSNKSWTGWPLTAKRYYSWFQSLLEDDHEFLGLFMDYETLGEHQWAETGIFDFLQEWIELTAKDNRFQFVTPSEAISSFTPRGPLHVPKNLSWADTERDVSAWLGNSIQDDAFERVHGLKDSVFETQSVHLIDEWRRLLTSDHFYYMCTKRSRDGEVHRYFSPFDSPYDAYLDYVNILEDFAIKCEAAQAKGTLAKIQGEIKSDQYSEGECQQSSIPPSLGQKSTSLPLGPMDT